MAKRWRVIVLVAVLALPACSRDGRYQAVVVDGDLLCRLDTRTGEAVCTEGRSRRSGWTAIEQATDE